jgi:hypothetical protein
MISKLTEFSKNLQKNPFLIVINTHPITRPSEGIRKDSHFKNPSVYNFVFGLPTFKKEGNFSIKIQELTRQRVIQIWRNLTDLADFGVKYQHKAPGISQ